jgi:TRAP-type C4-dicarboxylate transport system permease large subunit
MAFSVVLFVILGMVTEGIPSVVLFGPLVFPIAEAMGIQQIHYAVTILLALGIGLYAPPLGIGYYGACAIMNCDPNEATTAIVPYLLVLTAVVVLLAAVPWLSLAFL